MAFEMTALCKYSALVMLLFILINRAEATDVSLLAEGEDTRWSKVCSKMDPAMDPTHEVRYGQDVVWQIPPNPKAVLFMAHGKDKGPLDYFDPAPHCRRCLGLPENRAVVLDALKSQYAIIAIKSVTEYWLPWGVEVWPPPSSEDRTIVTSVVKEWTKEHSLDHLPLAAFGYSSGGNFSTLLAHELDFKSLILMCTPGELESLSHANSSFPPTLYLAMPVDKDGFYPQVTTARNILESKGVRTGQIDMLPRPVRPSNFTQKIPCFERATAERLYSAYKAENWLDDDDYVLKSPYAFDFEAVLWKHKVLPFCETSNDLCLAKHVEQEIILAYAFHSFSAQYSKEIVDWLDSSMFFGSFEPAGLWASQ